MRALLLIVCLPGLSLAAEPVLNVKPRFCIVDERTPSCALTFLLEWTAPDPALHCVRFDVEETPLQCWPEADNGSLEDERSVSETVRYQLDGGNAADSLASATVEVLRKDSDDRRRRRRTRHVWDIM